MIPVVAALVVQGGRLMACQRPAGKHMAGKWEFPGGKLEPGESPRQALERELMEELGVKAAIGRIYDAIVYDYPDRSVLLLFYAASISGEPQPIDEAQVRFLLPGELSGMDWAPADLSLIERIQHDGLDYIARLADV